MAAQDIGVVYVHVEPSGKGFGKSIEGDIGDAVSKASRKGSNTLVSKIGGAFGKIGKVGTGAIATIAGGITALAAKGGFTRALNIENAQAKLKGLGHDSASVTEIMNDALASVKGTAFGLGDAATVAASLSASGVKEGGELTQVLKTVADTAQISGRSLTDIGTIFGSVAARGKLQGDDMLQLMSSGIPVLQMLGKHLNKTSAEVSDMVSDGKIDFQTFADAMKEGLGGAALSAGTTFTGALANVKAALSRLGESAATPIMEDLRKTFVALIPAVDAFTNQAKPLVGTFVNRLEPAFDKVIGLIGQLSSGLQNGSITIGDLAGKVATLAGGLALLGGAGGNADKIIGLLDQLGKTGDKGLSDLVSGLKKSSSEVSGAFDAVKSKVDTFKAYLTPALRDAMTIDGDPFANAINRVKTGGSQFASATDDMFKAIRRKLTPGMSSLTFRWENSGLYAGLNGMQNGLSSFGSTLRGKAGQLGGAITKGLATAAGGINTSPLGKAVTAIGSKTRPLFNKSVREAMTLDGDPFVTVLAKISAKTSTITGKLSSLAVPFKTAFGNIFGGLGDAIGGPLQNAIGKAGTGLQNGLNAIGGLVTRFFAPGNFIKFLGIGALAAALVAGIGMIDSQMGGQLSLVINSAFASLPGILSKAETWIQSSLPQFVSSGTYIIEMVIQGITSALPSLVSVGASLIDTIVTGLASHLPTLMPMAVTLVTSLVTSLIAAAPQLMSAGLTLLDGLLQGIVASLPTLAAAIPQIITAIIIALATGLPQLMGQGVQMILNLVNGLVSAMPQLVAQVPRIISTLIDGLCNNLPQILSTGVQMLVTLVTGLAQALPLLIAYVPQIIASIVNTIASHLPQILSTGVKLLVTLASGLVSAIPQLVGKIPSIISSIKNAFTSVNWGSVGLNIIRGIASGIASAAGDLVNAAVKAAKNALDFVKKALGIHSPSRVFRDEVGVMVGRGMALGIDDSAAVVNRSMDSLVSSMSLSDADWSKTGRLNVTAGTGANAGDGDLRELIAAVESLHDDLGSIIARYTPTIGDRDFARKVRSAIA